MSARKPAIKRVPPDGNKERRDFDEATKETIEILTGRRGQKIAALSSGASSAEIAAKVNEILALLQG